MRVLMRTEKPHSSAPMSFVLPLITLLLHCDIFYFNIMGLGNIGNYSFHPHE